MWVAHEWRSTCGLSRSPRPTRSACARTIPHAPCRESRPPRAFRNTASASPRLAHRSGTSAPRPLGASQSVSASAASRPIGTTRSMAALAEHAHDPVGQVDVAHRQARRARRCGCPCRTAPRGWPGRGARAGRCRRPTRGATRPRPRSAASAGPGGTFGDSTAAAGLRADAALLGEEPVQRAHGDERSSDRGRGLARRAAGSATYRSMSASVDRVERAVHGGRDTRSTRAGRVGRRRCVLAERPRSTVSHDRNSSASSGNGGCRRRHGARSPDARAAPERAAGR